MECGPKSSSLSGCYSRSLASGSRLRLPALTLLRVRQQRLEIQHEMPHPLGHAPRSDQERLVLPLLLDLVPACPGGGHIVLRGLAFALALAALSNVVGRFQDARHGAGDGVDIEEMTR